MSASHSLLDSAVILHYVRTSRVGSTRTPSTIKLEIMDKGKQRATDNDNASADAASPHQDDLHQRAEAASTLASRPSPPSVCIIAIGMAGSGKQWTPASVTCAHPSWLIIREDYAHPSSHIVFTWQEQTTLRPEPGSSSREFGL